MAKSPAKVSVECPHCGFTQSEYAAARNTICRQCGSNYVPAALRLAAKARAQLEPVSAAAEPSVRQRIEGLFHRHRSAVVECFECQRKQEVTSSAKSTICPACSAHIDLQDYKISSSFSRNIRTRGAVHITAKADLSSSSVMCNGALIQGRLRGSLTCFGEAVVDYSGKVAGRLTAHRLLIERKSDVQCFRRVRVGSIEIRGHMAGEIIAESVVSIMKHGSLDGNVTARAINVERGGIFSGQLVIGQAQLQQAELLPVSAPATKASADELPGLELTLPAVL